MITTILFDLDGTLLPMDQDLVIRRYMEGLTAKIVPFGFEPKTIAKSIWTGTGAMVKNDGSALNEAVFWKTFSACCGQDMKAYMDSVDEFYRVDFQALRSLCTPEPLAAQTVALLKEKDKQLVLATNPLFPAVATQSRVRWAGLEPSDFVRITTYENSSYSKPNPDYYREILAKLNLTPEECLMVGNDVTEDMIAESLGMQVFLLTPCLINKENKDISRYPHGDFQDLMDLIRSL